MGWGQALTLQPRPPAPRHLTASWGAPGTWLSPVHGRGSVVPTPRCDGMSEDGSSRGEGSCPGVSREGKARREGKAQAERKTKAEQAGREGRNRQQNQARACAFKHHSSAAGSQGCLRQTLIYLRPAHAAASGAAPGAPAAPCPAPLRTGLCVPHALLQALARTGPPSLPTAGNGETSLALWAAPKPVAWGQQAGGAVVSAPNSHASAPTGSGCLGRW